MCGIAGGVWTAEARVPRDAIERMTDVLTHRGPDDRGVFYTHSPSLLANDTPLEIALGARRLSIIDVAGGHQPISNEDGQITIAMNGEIYNFRELRRRLEGAGHRFKTHCDTEVVLHLYEELGVEAFAQLNGMFAVAIWDNHHRRLVLARDRLGKKPLVYSQQSGRLLFASQIKSLLEVEGVSRDIDPQAIDEYLTYQYVPHPRTIFREIKKLPPAHWAIYQGGRLEQGCFWRPDYNRQIGGDPRDASQQLRELLTSAVTLRLESEVPLGAFLSGGIDSSIIVGLMQQAAGRQIRTFSIGFPVKEYDETAYARQVAEHLGTSHREFRVEPRAVEIFDDLVWHFDEPFADSSAIPTYYVSKLAREEVTVALTGDGGDELFAGYSRYQAVQIAGWFDRLPAPLRMLIANRLWQTIPSGTQQRSKLRQLKRLLAELPQSPAKRYLGWIAIFGESRRAALYTDEFVERLSNQDPVWFLREALARSRNRDPVTAASLADLVTYLPCDLMTKVDVASMAHSLECRQPFLDYRVVELAASMPIGWKYRRLRGKRILIETFADFLPPAVQRRGKMGFGVPLENWFRNELRDFTADALLSSDTLCHAYFRPEAIRQLFDEHQAKVFDHSARLWALLFFELWQRRWRPT